ncbi:hypothetical protein SLS62_007247 [Diatrype stigma]|uniref:O-methyltransferase domain-containing protein n=1 Tax=Diatrype stigma TaxID=117547 RepID=A0AAN9UZR2_9PEZI
MASSSKPPRMVELASKISSSVAELQELLSAQGEPAPSFDEDSPPTLPDGAGRIQDAVLDATLELHEMLLEPMSLIYKFAGLANLVSLDVICRHRIADIVPAAGGQISFGDIAAKTGLREHVVRRLLRHAMAMRVFQEPEPGMVAQTQASRLLAIPYINAWVSLGARESWPASTKVKQLFLFFFFSTVDAMEKWPESEEPNETGFSLANNTDKSIYDVLGNDPARAMRFAASMKSFDHFPGYATGEVSKAYDWTSLGETYMVDVGGSKGHVSVAVAKQFPRLKILVQDMAMVVNGAESNIPDELKGRISFMAHGLFDPQPVQADVYFFRMVFHNWADKYAVKILKAQIPALRPGATILIQDTVMPEPNPHRGMDLNMATFFNARERYLDEWKGLLAAADDRFVLQRVVKPEESVFSILEIGDAANTDIKLPPAVFDRLPSELIDVDGPLGMDIPNIEYTAADDGVIDQWLRENVATTWHSLGTCKMAPREENGVVDETLSVYGVTGLRVADLSTPPSNVGAHTNNVALTIGEKTASIFIEELGLAQKT